MAFLVGLLGAWLLLSGATFRTLLTDPDVMLLTGLAVTVAGWLAVRRVLARERVPVVIVWLGGALLWALVSTAFSLYPRGSLEECFRLSWAFSMLAAGLLIGRVPERRRAALIGCLLAASPIVWLAVKEGLGVRLPLGGFYTEFGRARAAATLSHPNNLAGFIALAAPLSLGAMAALLSRRSRWAVLPGVLALALLCAAAATYSKGGQLAVLCGVAAWLLSLPTAGFQTWLRADRRRRALAPVVGVAIVAALTVLFWVSPLGDRLRLFWQLRATLPQFERWGTWQAAARMVLAHPLTGVGPAAFGLAIPAYKTAASHSQLFTHAHDWYLQVAAEQGLVGLFLWSGALLSGVMGLRRSIAVADAESRFWLQGLLAGELGFLAAGLLDYNVGVPCIALAFWFAVGLGAAGDRLGVEDVPRRTLVVAGAVVAGLVMVPWLFFNRGQAAYLQCCAAVQQGRLAEAAAALEVARSRDPYQRGYDLVRSDLAAWSGQWQLCASRLQELAGSERPPLDSFFLDRLAWISVRAGDPAAARDWLVQAMAKDPAEPALRVDLGLVTMAADPSVAQQAFDQAAAQTPDAIGSQAGLGALALELGQPASAAEAFGKGARVGNPRDRPPRFLVAYGCVDPALALPPAQAGLAQSDRVRYHGAAVPRLRLLAMELAALARADSAGSEQEPEAAAPKPR